MRWFRPKIRTKLFEIPTRRGIVRVSLNDGGIRLEDPDGESHWDGWATIEDIASGLMEVSRVPPDEAHYVAVEVVRQWEEWLGDRRHDYPRRSN